jgi:hypothetical protein
MCEGSFVFSLKTNPLKRNKRLSDKVILLILAKGNIFYECKDPISKKPASSYYKLSCR